MKLPSKVIGVMSGTSLDGLDIAYCIIQRRKNKWTYRILNAETIPYSNMWKKRIKSLSSLSSSELCEIDFTYGSLIGNYVHKFINKHNIKPELVASHGHTIFHQPEKGITVQIGSGAAIAASCGFPVVCDFRTLDVALGGQGAPLVPIGDKLLFSEYDFCLNIGGIANISFEKNSKRVAFDICPANFVLNYLSEKEGKAFDRNGNIASSGRINENLLYKLNALSYYKRKFPKSMGREEIEKFFIPLLDTFRISNSDKLRTFSEHIALQISRVTKIKSVESSLLSTGGGSFNTFLMKRIRFHSKSQVHIPDLLLVKYKEALLFGLLGVLRVARKINTLASVTGARRDSCGGTIYLG